MTTLPPYVTAILAQSFTEAQARAIDQSWHQYSELNLSEASRFQIIKEARRVLTTTNKRREAPKLR